MIKRWRRGLIVLTAGTVLSVAAVAPVSASEIGSKPTVSVSCDATNLCKETITARLGAFTYTVVISFVDKHKSGSLTRGDSIVSITASKA